MKTISSSIVKGINQALAAETKGCRATSEYASKQRAEKRASIIATLAAGDRTVKVYDSRDKATRKIVERTRPYSPGKLVEATIEAVRLGATLEEFGEAQAAIASRFGWAAVKDQIMAAAVEAKLEADVVAHVFGLVAPEDKVVASGGEEEAEEEQAPPAAESAEGEAKPLTKAERRRAAKAATKAA